jgi:hypothetical protein
LEMRCRKFETSNDIRRHIRIESKPRNPFFRFLRCENTLPRRFKLRKTVALLSRNSSAIYTQKSPKADC